MAARDRGTFSAGYAASDVVAKEIIAGQSDPCLELNVKTLAWNLAHVRETVGGRPIMAVVKSNAYAHGTVGIALARQEQGVRHFVVAEV